MKAGEAGPDWLRILSSRRFFRIIDFDVRAAVEFAAMQNEKTRSGAGKKTTTRAKAKFDDQIVAIARVERASVIYSSDSDIVRLASGEINVVRVSNLSLPLEDPQMNLGLAGREES